MRFVLAAVFLGAGISAVPTVHAETANSRESNDAKVRQGQQIGRVIPSSDGRIFVYEWLRPWSWGPDTSWLPSAAGKRMHSWLYIVDTTRMRQNITSRYLFPQRTGASYYLGALSPDNQRVSFYSVDYDEKQIRAGVWDMTNEQFSWFDAPPVAARLEETPVWIAADRIAYRSGGAWVSGTVPLEKQVIGPIVPRDWDDTVKTTACIDCAALERSQRANPGRRARSKPGKATPVARSPLGDLIVYIQDTPRSISLSFQKGSEEKITVLQNSKVVKQVPPVYEVQAMDAGELGPAPSEPEKPS